MPKRATIRTVSAAALKATMTARVLAQERVAEI